MLLSILFFIIALLYSLVGFGGGSSYTALLSSFNVPFELIPIISLTCNLIVVSSGCWFYFKKGLIDKNLLFPFIFASTPMAYIGGQFPISEKYFFIILSLTLILSGVRLLFIKAKENNAIKTPHLYIKVIVGLILGFVSGLVGIGGGIFLSPLIINMGWATSKFAASTASFFIFINSIAGLAGQLLKQDTIEVNNDYVWLFLAVFIGGQVGSRLTTHNKVSLKFVQTATGVLVLMVGVRVFWKSFI